jgi:hypothetical protein
MRKILTLLKYASTMASMAGGMGTSGSRRGFKYMGLITSLIMLLALGLPMFFFGLSTLRSLAIPLTSVNIPLPGYLSDMVLALGLISGALFFFLSYSPSVAFNLFGSPDIELLLTFPLKRSQIFLYKRSTAWPWGRWESPSYCPFFSPMPSPWAIPGYWPFLLRSFSWYSSGPSPCWWQPSSHG